MLPYHQSIGDAEIGGGKMQIGIMGAGAIGGYLAARLAAASHELALIARGPHFARHSRARTAPA